MDKMEKMEMRIKVDLGVIEPIIFMYENVLYKTQGMIVDPENKTVIGKALASEEYANILRMLAGSNPNV